MRGFFVSRHASRRHGSQFRIEKIHVRATHLLHDGINPDFVDSREKLMKHKKYWGGRLRRLGDVIAGTAAALAVVATGYVQGAALAEVLPYVAGTLIAILALWLVTSFIANEMEGDDE